MPSKMRDLGIYDKAFEPEIRYARHPGAGAPADDEGMEGHGRGRQSPQRCRYKL